MSLKQLWGWFASYLYLPRLRSRSVLAGAVRAGLEKPTWEGEAFAYAAAKAEDGSYRGLVAGRSADVVIDGSSFLVKPEVAAKLIVTPPEPPKGGGPYPPGGGGDQGTDTRIAEGPRKTVRFSGSVALKDPSRPVPELTSIARDVLAHLATGNDNPIRPHRADLIWPHPDPFLTIGMGAVQAFLAPPFRDFWLARSR